MCSDSIQQANFVAVDAIPISDQIPRRIPLAERLDDLLGSSACDGVLSPIEIQRLAVIQPQSARIAKIGGAVLKPAPPKRVA